MTRAATHDLAAVLREARALVGHPDNVFASSTWPDTQAAMRELDGLIARLGKRTLPAREELEGLFAPSGPIWQVSASSGWARQFDELVRRVEAGGGRAYG